MLALSSASAAIFTYTGSLSGAQEFPANASTAAGFAVIDYNDVPRTLTVNVTFSGLSAGVAIGFPTSPGFPLGVTSGTYNNVFDFTSAATFSGAFTTANGGTVTSGQSYVNIHNATFSGDEICGQLAPVPEPATILVLCSGLGFLA